jgi:hypothetical protein
MLKTNDFRAAITHLIMKNNNLQGIAQRLREHLQRRFVPVFSASNHVFEYPPIRVP